jgi:thiol:disulfide interchange protein DsbD
MKKGLVLIVILVTALQASFGQILEPVKWTWAAEPMPMVKGKYKLVFKAKIENNWHVYSQTVPEGGPMPLVITFNKKNNDIEYIGPTKESGPKVHNEFEKMFGMKTKYYADEMTCEQIIKVNKDMVITGTLEYQTCDDSKCLFNSFDFEFDLKKLPASQVEVVWNSSEDPKQTDPKVISSTDSSLNKLVQASIDSSLVKDSLKATTAQLDTARFSGPISDCKTGDSGVAEAQSIWSIILLGFLGGFTALLTPCVFPMIPLTVSFFTKRSESKTKGKLEALFYGFSIVLIYFLLAVPFLIFNISPDTLNEISTGAPLNVLFFVVFVIFAFSFLGFYEIQLPSFIANKADSASNVGGLVGIFFMAVTLAIVSFSCTGPILGTLLVGALSSSGGKLNLVAGMTSFGFALALPFGVFAMFPNLMKSLPKSGGWLDTVKKVLGFVELAFALKFLSNADLVAHWGLLKREVFLGLWALIGISGAMNLLGWLKLPHDSPVKFTVIRTAVIAFAVAFSVYCIYGIPGNTLNLLSGFPPPKSYSIIKNKQEIEPIHNDYAAALARAKAENKPLMIDYTGWACVNCRKMEENVWPNEEIRQRLAEDFVVVSLYVDDKELLPENEQYVSTFSGKKIKTVGNKLSEMQAKHFNNNTQPFYVLVSPDEKLLNSPVGYTPDVEQYKDFLDCGLSAYKQVAKN